MKMNMTWDKNIYSYLDDESCVLVMRNKKWFNNNLPKFESAWKDIVYDRKNGYEHEKPKKREKHHLLVKILQYNYRNNHYWDIHHIVVTTMMTMY